MNERAKQKPEYCHFVLPTVYQFQVQCLLYAFFSLLALLYCNPCMLTLFQSLIQSLPSMLAAAACVCSRIASTQGLLRRAVVAGTASRSISVLASVAWSTGDNNKPPSSLDWLNATNADAAAKTAAAKAAADAGAQRKPNPLNIGFSVDELQAAAAAKSDKGNSNSDLQAFFADFTPEKKPESEATERKAHPMHQGVSVDELQAAAQRMGERSKVDSDANFASFLADFNAGKQLQEEADAARKLAPSDFNPAAVQADIAASTKDVTTPTEQEARALLSKIPAALRADFEWSAGLAPPRPEMLQLGAQIIDPEQADVLRIRFTKNNVKFVYSTATGQMRYFKTAGSAGFKNAKRKSTFAGQQACYQVVQHIMTMEKRRHPIRVFLSGMSVARSSVMRVVTNSPLNIISYTDISPIPHNGCRPRKARRI
ncbi:hypothetical protein CAOG_09127 [Capsaspora owczarzaki ATCC 30864]|uniref:Ribosomal protein S11 n=1 Tax=Capsaspora owczarzaki (strain ATCC 30864) TaxID=595528 RepID=A0A0D2X5E2_CAPO3|nr:hypothetical protein CAOG_09127 [Capsaspora owczarzaki ATCC 30864]KJE97654.1 hypothetical protein CAOG_009127 [Capsaspora owczarzaki ATCC 30864]|eukprot:XP_011270837.1 hypothetical protein CAOG_09127 [Capsaspora owczarzaki ATCC 30864]